MPTTRLKARLDALIWVLIFGGMFAFVLGIASRATAPAAGWSFMISGSCATVVGIVLIWVRSRLGPDV
ncbi:MAG: hypothetical protein NVS3B2_16300 [Ramlibacter sp.]